MKTFTIILTEQQGLAMLQMLDLALKSGGANVADAFIELRNAIRAGAQQAIEADKIEPMVQGK